MPDATATEPYGLDDSRPIEPRLSATEREELACITYFLAQWEALRARGLIGADASQAVAAEYAARKEDIERRGRYEAALLAARNLMAARPVDALAWADRARQLDPARREAWALAIDLHWRLNQFDEAMALGAEAAGRFPELQARLDDLRREHQTREATRLAQLDRQRREQAAAALLAKARDAAWQGAEAEVIALCSQLLEDRPDHPEALALLAQTHEELGHRDEALTLYRRLRLLQPGHPDWPKRLRALQGRRPVPASSDDLEILVIGEEDDAGPEAAIPGPPAPAPAPGLSWASIAGEFLQDHWQKLILCLAVLLILVSSTVGAHLLLGPLLWSPAGKSILALVYTLMFAALGAGLVRWGAERAGRMMLVTTLIVVPINFMLAGELKLLIEPTASRLAVLALDATALWLLTRAVAGTLAVGRGRFLAVALFALSACNAATARDIPLGWGLVAFLIPPGIFLAAVGWLNTRFRRDPMGTGTSAALRSQSPLDPMGTGTSAALRSQSPLDPGFEDVEEHRDFAYFALGLLTYAFLSGAIRTGVFVLHLVPPLYAVPVMLAAIACAHTAHHLPRFDKDARRILLLRFGGLTLSGLAFALCLARPPVASALLSGNTLATALLGLALYAASLSAYRQPAYLYLSFAALFLAYFGAFYFLVDLIRSVEETARHALGYGAKQKLPAPFKALNGLVFNVVLALLARLFERRWQDRRLARHCHAIGVPFSIAACVFSGFEPKAATLCLSGYAALYAIAVPVFGQPLVAYLACAALTGAAYFGSTLVPGMTLEVQALGAAGLGLAFWMIQEALGARRVDRPFRVPLLHAALALAPVAMGMAAATVLPPHGVAPAAPATFLIVALLFALIARDEPRPAPAYLAVIAADVGAALLLLLADARWALHAQAAHFGIAAAAAGLALAFLGGWFERVGRRRGRAGLLDLYPRPLCQVALVQVALGIGLCGVQVWARDLQPGPGDFAAMAVALALGAGALVTIGALGSHGRLLAYLAVGAGAAAFGAGALAGLTAIPVQPLGAAAAVAFGLLAWLLGEAGRRVAGGWDQRGQAPPLRSGASPLCGTQRGQAPPLRSGASPLWFPAAVYREPLLHEAFLAVGLTWLLCAANWSSFPHVAIALALTTWTLVAATRVYPVAALAHLAMAGALGVWLCAFELATGRAVATPDIYGAVVASFALVLLAVGEGICWRVDRRWKRGESGVARPESSTGEARGGLTTTPVDDSGRATRPDPSHRAVLFVGALADFALVAVCVASGLAGWTLDVRPPVALTLALGAGALLWMTQFRREVALVYLGLGSAVGAVLCLCAGWVAWTDLGLGMGWLSLTAAGAALALWCAGSECKAKGASVFYVAPCFEMSLLLAAGACVLAVGARLDSIGAFPAGVAALLLGALTLVLLTEAWREEALVYGAILAFVAASYVTLLSAGTPSGSSWVLGLVAAGEAILFWPIGWMCRHLLRGEGRDVYSRPLAVAAQILTILAVIPAYNSPLTMLLVAVSFLLMIESLPAAEWLYATFASAGCAAYFAVLATWPRSWVMAAAVAAAFGLWGLGMLLRRARPFLHERLHLKDLGYEFPAFNAAVAAGLLALALRVDASLRLGVAWTAEPALLPVLAVFCLLMLKPYPHRSWVHEAVLLVTAAVAVQAHPLLPSPLWWLTAGMAVAHAWSLVRSGAGRIEAPLKRRLGVAGEGYAEVAGEWSDGLAVLTAVGAAAVVIATTFVTVFAPPAPLAVTTVGDWSGVLLTLLLAGIYVAVASRQLDGEQVVMGLLGVVTLIVWWLAAPASPVLAGLGLNAAISLPPATAVVALAAVLLGVRFANDEAGDRDEARSGRLAAVFGMAGFVLAVLGVTFTRGVVHPTTVLTLLLAAATFTILALSWRRIEAAYAGGVAWGGACLFAALEVARWWGLAADAQVAIAVALGEVAALSVLWAAAGWLRGRGSHRMRPDSLGKGQKRESVGDEALTLTRSQGERGPDREEARTGVALAWERVAFVASLVAAIAVAVSATDGAALGDVATAAGVGVLLVLTLFDILLARRWDAEGLVYAAQASLLGAYFYYRNAFPLPVATDAAVLVLFGYLDLGIAEVMQRLRWNLYARPTLYVSLLLPLLPLGLAVWHGRPDEVNLFILLTTATFYGVACYTMQWKAPGYAAAVLLNAFLWVLWSRVGWRLADNPQFYLIPVGLSAILLAEVNRRELGRDYVNALRSIGLLVIYLSLAVPIGMTQSFGAWLALLLLSLAGIFAGIGLQVQSFLWLGLVGFVLDVVYQLGRLGTEHALAKWGIMLALGLLLILFVAFNEKKQIVRTMRDYYEKARHWE